MRHSPRLHFVKKRGLLTLIAIAVILIILPLLVLTLQQQQELRQRASESDNLVEGLDGFVRGQDGRERIIRETGVYQLHGTKTGSATIQADIFVKNSDPLQYLDRTYQVGQTFTVGADEEIHVIVRGGLNGGDVSNVGLAKRMESPNLVTRTDFIDGFTIAPNGGREQVITDNITPNDSYLLTGSKTGTATIQGDIYSAPDANYRRTVQINSPFLFGYTEGSIRVIVRGHVSGGRVSNIRLVRLGNFAGVSMASLDGFVRGQDGRERIVRDPGRYTLAGTKTGSATIQADIFVKNSDPLQYLQRTYTPGQTFDVGNNEEIHVIVRGGINGGTVSGVSLTRVSPPSSPTPTQTPPPEPSATIWSSGGVVPASPADNQDVTINFNRNERVNYVNLVIDGDEGRDHGDTVQVQLPLANGAAAIVWPSAHRQHTPGTYTVAIKPYYCQSAERTNCTAGSLSSASVTISPVATATPSPAPSVTIRTTDPVLPPNPTDNQDVTIYFNKNNSVNAVNLKIDEDENTQTVQVQVPLSNTSGSITWPSAHPKHTPGTHTVAVKPYYCIDNNPQGTCVAGTESQTSVTISALPTATPTPAPSATIWSSGGVVPASPADNQDVTINFNRNERVNYVNLVIDGDEGRDHGDTVQVQLPLANGAAAIVWPSAHRQHTPGTYTVAIKPYYCQSAERTNCTAGSLSSASVTISQIPTATPTPTPQFIVGDVNNDRCISTADYTEWVYAFTHNSIARNPLYRPNLNNDSLVNLLDFNIWYQAMRAGTNRCL